MRRFISCKADQGSYSMQRLWQNHFPLVFKQVFVMKQQFDSSPHSLNSSLALSVSLWGVRRRSPKPIPLSVRKDLVPWLTNEAPRSL